MSYMRLSKISEALPHECQCGSRAGRGGSDSKSNFFQALKKRREHGEETWRLLLDLVKAFDRAPREALLWGVMPKLGVPLAHVAIPLFALSDPGTSCIAVFISGSDLTQMQMQMQRFPALPLPSWMLSATSSSPRVAI
jgi:hypothetical protein